MTTFKNKTPDYMSAKKCPRHQKVNVQKLTFKKEVKTKNATQNVRKTQ